ncbi:hypothetical protein B0H10DRAFT_2325734 [Mycena sp. CBHHK59/15]|nr:hypothetical protein B0H10DRAFT_2325734 [Mycena sp. CBHHK59/15]
MEFRNHVYSPAYIELNAGKFLDHEWVDISGLKQYLRRQTQNSGPAASTTHPSAPPGSGSVASTRLSAVSDPVRVKIEATATPASASLVKAESPAQIKMRTLNEDGQEVFELLSDSEADTDGRDSDLEVMEALHRTSRSSSTIPPCVTVDADDCPDDESECGDPSGMASSELNGIWIWREFEDLEYYDHTVFADKSAFLTDLADDLTITGVSAAMAAMGSDDVDEEDEEDDSEPLGSNSDSNWAPHGSKPMFMLDLLDNLPRLGLSDDHLKAIIWVMKECGTANVQSFYALRKMQAKLTKDVGLKPQHHTSALGNQFYMNHPNDLIRLVRIFLV